MSRSVSAIIDAHRPSLDKYEETYKYFHQNPELSFQEFETAAKIKELLAELDGFEIFPNISTGLAAVLKNGTGKTVLLRADIDGLPVLEKTGLEYASKKTMNDLEGVEKPVMHACGHDMHITSLLAASELLVAAKASWSGTLILVFQPAEEKGAGAQAMVDAALYSKVPIPDIVLGGHVMPLRTGTLETKPGLFASSADSFAVTLHGKSGHASQPHRTVDPIVCAAHTILRLQGIVSRETDPADHAVLTVASVHAGDAENIIPDSATLKLDIRAVSEETRSRILASMHRIIAAESTASNAPQDPSITRLRTFPFLINDALATSTLASSFSSHFGSSYRTAKKGLGGSEDFGVLATSVGRPAVFWVYGGVDAEVWDGAERKGRLVEDIPINHSAYFAPVIMPTLKIAVDAYAVAALTWLG